MRPIIRFDQIDSTNACLKRLAREGAIDGTVVTALRQSQGRGRLGRSFHSPEGGLYMSILIRNEKALASPLLLTSLAAVALRRAILRVSGLSCEIKWVNDIYSGGRKLAGILAEAITDGSRLSAVVLGIGVNLAQRDFPPEIADSATSVFLETDKIFSPDELLTAIPDELDPLILSLPYDEWLAEYRAHSYLTGKIVTVLNAGDPYTAIVKGIGARGELLIEKDGVSASIDTGDVTVRPAHFTD